ncbi:MAG: hypothetical protein DM484_29850 [Candidatus Methylumidiphilus alinenensis]|uniref:LTXXQ motif family protein n=1 Tax=Candidatus Methylumidiphilus alinenensis TaxID=2202197 RepID=A0A2W4QFS7_9GAMM|nr:MAG: hypothetical protein DM484_29850 [Candidatus Methylumidiphilus alinenensis]
MKQLSKITIIVFAVSSLLAGRQVLAEPADASAAPGKQAPAAGEPKKCEHWKEGKEKRLETLKSDLKLTASQEAAWTEWAGKIKGDRKGWEEKRKDFESLENLPAPQRLEKMLEFSKEHIAKQETVLAATKTFYAVLTPEQQQVFDKGFRFGHRGGPDKGGKQQ